MKLLRTIWGILLCIYGIALYLKYFQIVSEGWKIVLTLLSGSLCILGIILMFKAIQKKE
jgi:uncharacterized membrane protein HdeD (DUF308 family)